MPAPGMAQIFYHNARQAALGRIASRLEHGIVKDRCIWRNRRQFDWMERICMKMVTLDDGRQRGIFWRGR
jgi:hypothetical protein